MSNYPTYLNFLIVSGRLGASNRSVWVYCDKDSKPSSYDPSHSRLRLHADIPLTLPAIRVDSENQTCTQLGGFLYGRDRHILRAYPAGRPG